MSPTSSLAGSPGLDKCPKISLLVSCCSSENRTKRSRAHCYNLCAAVSQELTNGGHNVRLQDYQTVPRPRDNQSPQKGTEDNFERLLFLKLKLRSMLRSGRFN